MFGWHSLKPQLVSTPDMECPVLGCTLNVARQRTNHLKRERQYYCPQHRIYISPSTFEYEDEADNILWHDESDDHLLNNIKKFKAETNRLGRERSEDALTWNVFRYIEKHQLIKEACESLVCPGIWSNAHLIYWSYDPLRGKPMDWLLRARVEFGEAESLDLAEGQRVSEPDMIVASDEAVAFIEAKFGATNKTSGTGRALQRKLDNPKKYVTGGGNWYGEVFRSDYETVVNDQKYELLRFWLLGSWIAEQQRKRFYLLNLVREGEESSIEAEFGTHIKPSDQRRFIRLTWEDLRKHLAANASQNTAKDRLLGYFEDKTIGYTSQGRLRRAFGSAFG